MGVKTIAVYSQADAKAKHVREADLAFPIGPPAASESYLNIARVLDAAKRSGAEAIHPGYGFLSENPDFAEAVTKAGLIWVGPTHASIRAMGLKDEAKRIAEEAGAPVVPGYRGADQSETTLLDAAKSIGFPILIKAIAGGGGRGIREVRAAGEFAAALTSAQREAKASFGDDRVLIEKLIEHPRHIEVQVFGDKQGGLVHLYERDCSLQRRHQKVWEEAPSPALNNEQRAQIGETTAKAIKKLGYLGVGTIEYLYENGEFYFIEMNTRLQVEHPVTEMITGIDLVREQIRIADGAPLSFKQREIEFTGHAIECRINAENPVTFMPSPGRIVDYHPPGGLGVRLDSAIYAGYAIPPNYDSLIGKLIVHGRDRTEALLRLKRALDEMVVSGIDTTIPLFEHLVEDPDIANGDYHIHWLEQHLKDAQD